MQLKKNRVLVRQGDKVEIVEVELSEDVNVDSIKEFIESMDLDFLGLEESLFHGF